jgi:hypothetical protein
MSGRLRREKSSFGIENVPIPGILRPPAPPPRRPAGAGAETFAVARADSSFGGGGAIMTDPGGIFTSTDGGFSFESGGWNVMTSPSRSTAVSTTSPLT